MDHLDHNEHKSAAGIQICFIGFLKNLQPLPKPLSNKSEAEPSLWPLKGCPRLVGTSNLDSAPLKCLVSLLPKRATAAERGTWSLHHLYNWGHSPKCRGHAPICKASWRLHIPSKTHIHVGQNILASSFPAVRVNCTPHPVSCSSSCGVRHARPTSRCRVATDGLTRNKCVRQRKTTHW